ncbi:hypothetical protein P4S93_02110 [Aneurinibacillus thermoaerophilus]|nr:hypothetical protein [Aneurinibacillus thermoaerophilus]MED0676048.1 hypothetical protein [Aneurinibacillus thermoaerophilus]MED0681106.1 hypothetical protein [Aneurinibacillus thermoaerophilus]MED0758451.1 hypothetical protein [Aneurinibacillus thermoaerophilus]MED0759579.1 hypothetical protein [Aneurinibacillus thermoaerophilus]MED0765138.1 hypothetical protein [Aneurinibacillus thermoaerophilus]
MGNNATIIRIEPPAVILYEQIDIVLNAIEKSLGMIAQEKATFCQ